MFRLCLFEKCQGGKIWIRSSRVLLRKVQSKKPRSQKQRDPHRSRRNVIAHRRRVERHDRGEHDRAKREQFGGSECRKLNAQTGDEAGYYSQEEEPGNLTDFECDLHPFPVGAFSSTRFAFRVS